ncbi:hypothetical protein [Bacillus subtilis]|uniref:hypothetical protein n=1 Tax=Bacillus subtilis TaxID=1423 RepID=UPI0004A5A399|nr:hypothetical protein [Bacillus subtilis]CCU57696.1 hypothetical protein BSUBE1_1065 [Bacillus subtilis E1]
MSNIEYYNVINHFYMPVEETCAGNVKDIWNWDVYIACKGFTYFGMAEEKIKGTIIAWTQLDSHEYFQEIQKLVVERSQREYHKSKG